MLNREKVEALIEGLRSEGEDVTLENLDKYLQREGVLVRVHVGRIRGNMELTPEVLGIDSQSEALADFFGQYAKNGSLSFIPLKDEKDLKRVESRLRMTKTRMAIGYDNSYMPIQTYRAFQDHLKKAQAEYEEVRDGIINDWTGVLARFEFTLDQALASLNPTARENIKKAIMKRIPSRQEYEESFYMRTSLKAFPVMENVELINEDLAGEVKEGAIEDNIKMVYEVLGGALAEAYETVNTVYASFEKNRRVPPKTHGSLKESVKRVKQRDLFKNAMVSKIVEDMELLSVELTSGDVPEMCEDILAKVYGYAKEIGVTMYINMKDSMVDKEDLELMYQTM